MSSLDMSSGGQKLEKWKGKLNLRIGTLRQFKPFHAAIRFNLSTELSRALAALSHSELQTFDLQPSTSEFCNKSQSTAFIKLGSLKLGKFSPMT